MLYKKTFIISIITAIIATIYFSIATYVHDPLQIFHKPWGRKATYIYNMRYQAVGIIKNEDFNNIIIGNSLSSNTSSFEASNVIGGNFVNLSTAGLTYNERYHIAKYALQKKKIENAIIQFDANLSVGLENHTSFIETAYSNNILEQVKMYANSKYLKCIITFSKNKKCIGNHMSLDRPDNWEKEEENKPNFQSISGLINRMSRGELKELNENLLKYQENLNDFPKDFENILELSKKSVKENLIQLIKNNHKTTFHIIMPAYHDLFWGSNDNQYVSYNIYKEVTKYLLEETKNLSNTKLYWFYDYEFIQDDNSYKDPIHYLSHINSIYLESIAERKDIVTIETIDNKFENLHKRLENFDTKPYIKMIKERSQNSKE